MVAPRVGDAMKRLEVPPLDYVRSLGDSFRAVLPESHAGVVLKVSMLVTMNRNFLRKD